MALSIKEKFVSFVIGGLIGIPVFALMIFVVVPNGW